MPEIEFRVRQPVRLCVLCQKPTDEAASTPGLGWQPAHMTCTSRLWIMYKRWLRGELRPHQIADATRMWGVQPSVRTKELTSGT